ncbi:EF-hand domain-containing protein [Litorisediminicola beolgyonensis]|uniref:EF-hand domain-containing protein n=1 Tax=Litorisediminicola beolgyonensis TaxID=1173614 RepID=A0ABW3ZGT6_9RHOB
MTTNRILPLAFVTAMLIGGGAMVATAQDAAQPAQPETSASETAPMRAHFRGEHGERGEHGGRGEHGAHGMRGGKHGPQGGMFGGRGQGQMFATLFAEIDADGDGSVTQDEIDTFRAARVAEADASGDGALSIEEFDTLYRAFTRARMVDQFQELDADGDGSISAAEMDARFGSIVERMDHDGDGALTLQRGRRG